MNQQPTYAEDAAIAIERTQEFRDIAVAVGDLLKSLPLTNSQHNQLVQAIIDQVQAGEAGAFRQGFSMGMELGRYFAEHPEECQPDPPAILH